VLIGLLIGLLVLLLLAGAYWLLFVRGLGNGSGSGGRTSPTAMAVGCEQLVGKSYPTVKAALENKGFTVNPTQVSGGTKERVADIAPCTAAANATLTVTVNTGKAGNGNGNGGSGGGNGGGSGPGGGNGGSQSASPSAKPSASCGGIGVGIDQSECPLPSAPGG
jgi:hypothetical protein